MFPDEQPSPRKRSQSHRSVLAEMRADSVLDPNIPLGFTPTARAEFGPSTEQYFNEKHKAGKIGKYWPLHMTHSHRIGRAERGTQ